MQERKQNDEEFTKNLKAAMDYAKSICLFGSSNKIDDLKRTSGWNRQLKYRYHIPGQYLKISENEFVPEEDSAANSSINSDNIYSYKEYDWYYHVSDFDQVNEPQIGLMSRTVESPLFDSSFQLTQKHINLLGGAMLAMSMRQGNCGMLCKVTAKYLWEHPEGITRIEGISTNNFDHVFVIVNREGELNKPETWGNAWIIDPWYKEGIVYKASEFKEIIKQVKAFANKQINLEKKEYHFNFQAYPDGPADEIEGCNWEINPEKDRYPTYSKHLKVEDYYVLHNDYHLDEKINSCNAIQKIHDQHRERFTPSLEQIQNLDTVVKRDSFFQSKKKLNSERKSEKKPPKKSMCLIL